MTISVVLLLIIVIFINAIAFSIYAKTIKRHALFTLDAETIKDIENVKLKSNKILKFRIIPLLFLMIILVPIVLYNFLSQDFERIEIIKNPKLVYAEITNKYTKQYGNKVYYYVEYKFELNNYRTNQTSYKGNGKINKKNYNEINDNTLLKVTYYDNNPQKSQIGDITNLSLKTMFINRLIPYFCLLCMYIIILLFTYYILFKIRTKCQVTDR
jgi:hypothetical protein